MEKRIFYITLILSALLFSGVGICGKQSLQTYCRPFSDTLVYNKRLSMYVLDPPDVTMTAEYDRSYGPVPQMYYTRKEAKELSALDRERRQKIIMDDFLHLTSGAKYRKNLKEARIILDPNPRTKLIRLAEEEGMDTTYQKYRRVPYPCLQIDGMTVEEVLRKYEAKRRYLRFIQTDTLRYGVCLNGHSLPSAAHYLVSKIHYAEVHRYRWDNPAWELNVYFIREGDALKAFWGWERNGAPLE